MSKTFEDTLNDKYLRLIGIPLFVITALWILMVLYFPGRWDLFAWYFVVSLVYASMTWEICRWVLLRVRSQFPGLENTRHRIVRTVFYFILISGFGNALVKAVLYESGLRPPALASKSFFESWLINFSANLFFVFLLSSIYEASYFFSQYKLAIQKTEQLKKQQAQQQFETLKNRVNPHFLFNSLTTLSALIGEDATRAERFVDELSKVYRYLLRAGRHTTATLGEELQFAESYSFLLESRFEEDAFMLVTEGQWSPISSQQKEWLDRSIPMLALQNAIDYLVRTQLVPLQIQVKVTSEQLCISCQNQPKTLSFDVSENDWHQLAGNHAYKELWNGQLTICIPFMNNPNKR